MKKVRKPVTAAATNTPGMRHAQKILKEIKQLQADLEYLYDMNEDMYDAMDVASLEDELRAANMFISHQINSL